MCEAFEKQLKLTLNSLHYVSLRRSTTYREVSALVKGEMVAVAQKCQEATIQNGLKEFSGGVDQSDGFVAVWWYRSPFQKK